MINMLVFLPKCYLFYEVLPVGPIISAISNEPIVHRPLFNLPGLLRQNLIIFFMKTIMWASGRQWPVVTHNYHNRASVQEIVYLVRTKPTRLQTPYSGDVGKVEETMEQSQQDMARKEVAVWKEKHHWREKATVGEAAELLGEGGCRGAVSHRGVGRLLEWDEPGAAEVPKCRAHL